MKLLKFSFANPVNDIFCHPATINRDRELEFVISLSTKLIFAVNGF